MRTRKNGFEEFDLTPQGKEKKGYGLLYWAIILVGLYFIGQLFFQIT